MGYLHILQLVSRIPSINSMENVSRLKTKSIDKFRLWRFLRELTALTAYSIIRICFHLSPVFFYCFSTTFSIANKTSFKNNGCFTEKNEQIYNIINWNPNFQSSKQTPSQPPSNFWGSTSCHHPGPWLPRLPWRPKVHLEFGKLSLNS